MSSLSQTSPRPRWSASSGIWASRSWRRRLVSCILHPFRRLERATVRLVPRVRVTAVRPLLAAGIRERRDAYDIDLFSPPEPFFKLPDAAWNSIRAFHAAGRPAQRIGCRPRNSSFPAIPVRHHAVATDEQLCRTSRCTAGTGASGSPLIADARRRGLSWITPARSAAFVKEPSHDDRNRLAADRSASGWPRRGRPAASPRRWPPSTSA